MEAASYMHKSRRRRSQVSVYLVCTPTNELPDVLPRSRNSSAVLARAGCCTRHSTISGAHRKAAAEAAAMPRNAEGNALSEHNLAPLAHPQATAAPPSAPRTRTQNPRVVMQQTAHTFAQHKPAPQRVDCPHTLTLTHTTHKTQGTKACVAELSTLANY